MYNLALNLLIRSISRVASSLRAARVLFRLAKQPLGGSTVGWPYLVAFSNEEAQNLYFAICVQSEGERE